MGKFFPYGKTRPFLCCRNARYGILQPINGRYPMSKLRAFVVEDSPVILESLTQTLEEVADVEGVATATDERGALAWMDARSNGCDVLIVDIFLKSDSGLGVLKGMRE